MMAPVLAVALAVAAICVVLAAYLYHCNQMLYNPPPEVARLAQKHWTEQHMRETYQKAETAPTDVRPFLFRKKNRRYIICGGSGLVGGWIVEHLLMRGEDPDAIRIIDLNPPSRSEHSKIAYIKTDVSDADSVVSAFRVPWPIQVASLPLTVFHTAAYISPADWDPVFLPRYEKVNVLGTLNVVNAARAMGASCLIATSSASTSVRPPSYFLWPWQSYPKDLYQILPNADRDSADGSLRSFGSCYAWSKYEAEKLVRDAHSNDFRTGAIRPAHGIYGHGVEHTSSVTWDYLRRGGSPSWLWEVIVHFVNAQNVSIAHLAFEDTLVRPGGADKTGGQAYCVTDPNPPIVYGDLYRMLMTLADPRTPIHFPRVPHLPLLALCYLIEAYAIFRQKYAAFLPALTGDLALMTPAMFNMCTAHFIFTDDRACKEIGYRAPIKSEEGFALQLIDWNEKVERKAAKKVEQGKGGEIAMQEESAVPKPPNVH